MEFLIEAQNVMLLCSSGPTRFLNTHQGFDRSNHIEPTQETFRIRANVMIIHLRATETCDSKQLSIENIGICMYIHLQGTNI